MENKIVFPFLLFFYIFLCTFGLFAKEINWPDKKYTRISFSEELSSFFDGLAVEVGIDFVLSDRIKGYTISKIFRKVKFKKIFDEILKDKNLIYFYDGLKIYLYRYDEIQEKKFILYNIRTDVLKKHLIEIGVFEDRFFWHILPINENFLMIRGPRRYIELVSDNILLLDKQDEVTVKVFKLKNAWVNDRTVSVRGRSFKIEGIASIFKKIVSGKTKIKLSHDKKAEISEQVQTLIKEKNEFSPKVVADARTNSLIVSDHVSKFPVYEKIIFLLDVPLPLIEISVSIFDVNVEDSSELGFNWLATTSNNKEDIDNKSLYTKEAKKDSEKLTGKTEGIFANWNFPLTNFTFGMPDFKKLFIRMKALEKEGKGKILSRPSVLTTNNLQALIDYSQTFYIRVQGNDGKASVTPVTVGTLLKVIPHIVELDDSSYRINLEVSIEDGTVSRNTDLDVDRIPRVFKTSVSTQATVRSGETLVVGGYHHEQKTIKKNGIPLLGRIPILGLLFTRSQVETSTLERIFVITPRIVNVDRGNFRE